LTPIHFFAAATLAPVPLLLAGAVFGGWWIVLALAYIALFSFVMDEFADGSVPDGDDTDAVAADQLSIGLAVAHFGLLIVALLAISGGTGLGWLESVGLLLSFGLFFGQISNSNAHELIHRSDKRLFKLGMWIYISLLFGHHTSAHRHVHHRFVATDEDPNTAALDESFYEFAPRAWFGGFRAGYEMEEALSGRMTALFGKGRRLNPYLVYVGGAIGCCLAALMIFGPIGLIGYLLLAFYAQIQLLLSDYVQHYGLLRRRLPGGKTEPVTAVHSWNAPHWFTGLMMLNAPRHSDHHTNPSQPYPELKLPGANTAPMLPYGLPAMAAIALFPPVWRRVMNPRAKAWRNAAEFRSQPGDQSLPA